MRGKRAFGKKDERFLQSSGYGRVDFRADDGAVVGRAAQAKNAVLLGNEVLAAEGFNVLAGKRVELITNPSGVIRKLDTTLAVLRAGPGVKNVALLVRTPAFRRNRANLPPKGGATNASNRGIFMAIFCRSLRQAIQEANIACLEAAASRPVTFILNEN